MINSILGIAFTPIAMVVTSLIGLIIYGIKALIDRKEEKKSKQKRFNALPEYRAFSSGQYNWHDFVDLGLPSGTKWATCNVGAPSSNEPGFYFTWGSTVAANNSIIYSIPRLDPLHDAATAHFGGMWRTPTKAEMEELVRFCKFIRARYYGKEGIMAIGPNNNTLFFPFTGMIYKDDSKPTGYEYGMNLWSSGECISSEGYPAAFTLDLSFGEAKVTNSMYKNHRIPVRPVFSIN